MIVQMIASHRAIMSANAHAGLWRVKKMIDQTALRTSWSKNTPSALRTSLRFQPLFHTKNAAMPMSRYNVVQTGANIQAGGLRVGLARVAYQVGSEEVVKNAPIVPASSEIAIAMINLKKDLGFTHIF